MAWSRSERGSKMRSSCRDSFKFWHGRPDEVGMSVEPAGGNGPRRPGQYGREVVRRKARWTILGIVALVASMVLLGILVGFHTPAFLLAEVAAIAGMLVVYSRTDRGLERRMRGVRAEQHVGAILDSLAAGGWLSLHDVASGRGNVDHIVVGPGGILTVETKSHRAPISIARLDGAWLRQAYAERKWLEGLIGERVDALLVLSNAYLIERGIWRQRGVLVLSARLLARHLRQRRCVYSPAEVQELHTRIVAALDAAPGVERPGR